MNDKWLELQRRCWNFAAAGCVELDEWLEHHYEPVTTEMLRLVPPPSGSALDVACGTGGLSRRLALSASEVVGIDLSAEMVLAAEESCGRFPNTRFRVQGADDPLEGIGPFDAAYSRFGLMFCADFPTALRNIRDVSQPGAGLAFSVWAPETQNQWSAAPTRVLLDYHHLNPATPTDPSAWRMADPEEVRTALIASGWSPMASEPVLVTGWEEGGPDVTWERLRKTAGPIGLLFERTPDEDRAALRARVVSAIAAVPPGGLTGNSWVHAARAV